MRGAVRPFVPGPLVIVNEKLKERVKFGRGLEEGRLTDEEKRQFMPPRRVLLAKKGTKRARRRERERRTATLYPVLKGW